MLLLWGILIFLATHIESNLNQDCYPTTCPKSYKPICAANQDEEKTFLNECVFKKEMCQEKDPKKMLEFKKKGPCKTWVKNSCPLGCNDVWAPVCASDGKTYSSICAVKLLGCGISNNEKPVRLKKIGYCAKDMCPESCPENYKPSCGTNGILYANECELKLSACRTKKINNLKSIPRKKCGNQCVKECPPHDNKICGSDDITYQNKCLLQQNNCLKKQKVTIIKVGPCDSIEISMPKLQAQILDPFTLATATMRRI